MERYLTIIQFSLRTHIFQFEENGLSLAHFRNVEDIHEGSEAIDTRISAAGIITPFMQPYERLR